MWSSTLCGNLLVAATRFLQQLASVWRRLLERVQYEHSLQYEHRLREYRNVDDLFSLRKPVLDRLDRVARVRKIASGVRWLAPARKRRGARFSISNPPLSSRRRVARRLRYSGSNRKPSRALRDMPLDMSPLTRARRTARLMVTQQCGVWASTHLTRHEY
jgi:hypothetical protein